MRRPSKWSNVTIEAPPLRARLCALDHEVVAVGMLPIAMNAGTVACDPETLRTTGCYVRGRR